VNFQLSKFKETLKFNSAFWFLILIFLLGHPLKKLKLKMAETRKRRQKKGKTIILLMATKAIKPKIQALRNDTLYTFWTSLFRKSVKADLHLLVCTKTQQNSCAREYLTQSYQRDHSGSYSIRCLENYIQAISLAWR